MLFPFFTYPLCPSIHPSPVTTTFTTESPRCHIQGENKAPAKSTAFTLHATPFLPSITRNQGRDKNLTWNYMHMYINKTFLAVSIWIKFYRNMPVLLSALATHCQADSFGLLKNLQFWESCFLQSQQNKFNCMGSQVCSDTKMSFLVPLLVFRFQALCQTSLKEKCWALCICIA